jgi:two-component system, NarL family, response regulator LiaR
MIKVLIVDDHPLVRKGLRTLLDVYEDIEITGEAADGRDAIKMCKKNLPDVILMDLVMPEINGIEATKTIMKDWPSVKVIVLTSFIDKKLIKDAFKAGAIGYILKNISGDDLIKSIINANKGESTLSSEASDYLISNFKDPTPEDYQLTNQEINILTHLIHGLSNKKIAQIQVLSLSTVKFHVSNILSKLGVSSRAEAIAVAMKNKLI